MKSLYDFSISIGEAINRLKMLDGSELEIKIMSPLTYEIGYMAATILEKYPDAIEINNFIEVIKHRESVDSKTVKIRSRTPYQNIKTMHMTPSVLLQYIKGSDCEKKTTIREEVIEENKISVVIAKEEPVVFSGNATTPPTISFVSQILCRVKSWIIDYKMKYNLKFDDSQLCSYILSGYKSPSVSVEIEFGGNPSAITASQINELHTIVFNQLFMTKIPSNRLYLDIIRELFTPIKKIKMDTMIMKQSDMVRSVETLSQHVTQKVNGSGCFFKIVSGTLFLSTPESELWKSYNIKMSGTYYGRGEMIDNTIYPFFVYNQDLGTASRLDHINSFFTAYKSTSIAEEISFIKKDFIGPFVSREARCAAILTLMKTIDYPIDGVIFMNGNQMIDINGTNIVDYKFKEDNTVDLLGVVVMNDIAFVGAPGINKSSNDSRVIHLTLFGKEGSSVERLGRTTITKNNSLFKYLVETKYFISQSLNKPILHFHKMIVECSLGSNSDSANNNNEMIVREIRLAKTDKFITHGSLGNNLSMIRNLKEIQSGTIQVQTLEALATKFDENMLEPSEAIISLSDTRDVKIVKVINDNTVYNLESQSSAIYIISQFVKTNLIYLACSPIFSNLYPPHIPVKTVLMIDGGSGDDIRKYHSNGINYYLLLDPSKEQIAKADKLFKLTEKRITQTQKGNIGSYNVRQLSILSDNFVNTTKQLMPKVNIIDWQLSLQYNWTMQTKERILNNLFQVSEYGTKLLITCFNGIKLREILSTEKTLQFKLTMDSNVVLNYIDELTYMNTSQNKSYNEFYVNLDEVVQELSSRGFMLITRGVFSQLMRNTENFFDYLHTLDTQESTKKFFTQVKSTKMYPMIYSDAIRYHNLMEYMFFIRVTK